MLTIGIPFYNAGLYLDDAIKSVRAQTFENWELILVNDGSTDDSVNIALKYTELDSRIRLINDGENKKLPFRLNQILDESKYNYIARMDADDIMHPDRLKIQLDYLENHQDVDLVSSSMYSIDIYNNITGKRIVNDQVNLDSLLRGNHQIIHPSIFARKEWYLRNKYNCLSDRAEDYELWLRTLLNNDLKIHILSDPLIFYREFGNLSKKKLILSYQTTNYIFHSLRKNISFSNLLKNRVINSYKIVVVNFLFSIGKQDLLVSRRNKELSTEEMKLANNFLLKALRLND